MNRYFFKICFFIIVLFVVQVVFIEKAFATTATIYAYSSSWFRSDFWYQSPPQPSWFAAVGGSSYYRSEMTFSTSTIPANAQISGVVLHIFPKACVASSPSLDLDISQLTINPNTLNKSTDAATIYSNAHGGNRYVDNTYELSILCNLNTDKSINLGATAASDFQSKLASGTNWFGLGLSSDAANSSVGQIWGYDNSSYKPYLVVTYIVNSGPVATYVSQPSQTSLNMVSTNVSVYDTDNNVTSLAVQFSTNTVDWVNATLGNVTPSIGTVATSSGSITSIDTDTGTTTLSIQWNFAADIANTSKTNVYLKVTPNDGTVDGTAQTSNAFYTITRVARINTTNTTVLNKTFSNILTNSLAGWWTFDGRETTAVTSIDKSGNGNNGTLTNEPVRKIGKIGQGLNFNGSNSYINVVHSSSINPSSAISLSAWVKSNSISGTSTIFLKGVNPFDGFWLYLNGNQPSVSFSRSGNNWTAKVNDATRTWYGVAISNNGTVQAAVANNTQIYISTSSGANWLAVESARQWRKIAMSGDGSNQAAIVNNGYVYFSSNTGTSWSAWVTSTHRWVDVAMSNNGSIIIAAYTFGTYSWEIVSYIYVSSDSGQTWNLKKTIGPGYNLTSLAMSSDGSRQVAVGSGGAYVSTDSGQTWNYDSHYPGSIASITMSSDGTKQLLAVILGTLRVSQDSGQTWTTVNLSKDWANVAMSGDGTMQTAVANSDYIYVSYDSGSTWTAKTTDATRNWRDVAISQDGTKQISGANYIFDSYAMNVSSNSSVSANSWYHLVGTFDGATSSIYVNGVLSAANYFYVTTTIDTNTSSLLIGGSASKYFNGTLDDLRIYNRALDLREVKKLYNFGRGTTVRF